MFSRQLLSVRRIPIWTYLLVASKLFGSSIPAYIVALPSFFKNVNKAGAIVKLFLVFAIVPLLVSIVFLDAAGVATVFSAFIFYFSFLYLIVIQNLWSLFVVRQLLEFLLRFSFAFNLLEFSLLNSPLQKYVYYFPEDHVHRALVLGFQKALGLGSTSSASGFTVVFIYILCEGVF